MDALLFGDADPIARHRSRVLSDSGQVQNLTFARAVAQWLRQSGEQDKTLLLALPGTGVKTRDSGLDRFITKLYSMQLPANDLTQTTEVNQPYLTGLIAPGDVTGLTNLHGSSRFASHPGISFANGSSWSLSVVCSWNGDYNPTTGSIVGDSDPSGGAIRFRVAGTNQLYWKASVAPGQGLLSNAISQYIGKNTIISIVSDGTKLTTYINGVFVSNLTTDTQFYLDALFRGRGSYFQGTASYYRLSHSIMSASQVASEAAMLRTYIPEIPAVQIVSQTWSIRNLDMVCTPAGNVIQEMQANSAVEKLTGWAFTAGWTPLNASVIDADSFNIDVSNGYLAKTGVTTVGKYYKITIAGTCAAGITNFRIIGTAVYKDGFTGSFSTTFIVKADATALFLRAFGTGQVDITTLSLQELGFTNSTEIYDAVYAAVSGDAATKNYAALKEAAMWRAYANSESNQVTYGKLYNGYAALLIDDDMVSSGYGWRVPTAAEQSTLINALGGTSVAGPKLKYSGTNYWNTANGTNETGFSALGTGLIQGSTGAEGGLKLGIRIWSTTINNALFILDNATCGVSTYDIRNGFPIRLIKT